VASAIIFSSAQEREENVASTFNELLFFATKVCGQALQWASHSELISERRTKHFQAKKIENTYWLYCSFDEISLPYV
jgi:hypothetical protein